MIEIIIVSLFFLWVIGLLSETAMGGAIHVLLIMAVFIFLMRVAQRQKAWH